MRIIFPHLDYSGSLVIAEADTLEGRRERLAQRFFRHNVLNETSYLHYLAQVTGTITGHRQSTAIFTNL